jgi:hypothetical protein
MTVVQKDCRNNWYAEDKFDLGNSKQLTLMTNKRYDGYLYTTAQVGTVADGFVSFVLCQDFSRCVKMSKVRCTAKNVQEMQGIGLGMLDYLKESARLHYAAQVTA